MSGVSKVCVIGAGTMGAGIAAQVANAGVPVLLLDMVTEGPDRSVVARKALERLGKSEPAAFMSKAAAKLVEVGNIEDDLAKVADCDWVIEAIIEKIEAKQALYERLEAVRKPGSAVSSNTSTMPLAVLTQGRSEAFQRDFLITHFFNPPRYMRLLEVVAGPQSDPALVAGISAFADRALGKSVVTARDTPGFIANRVGTFWLQSAVNAAFDLGVSVEDADAIAGKPMGVPKTGIFGLVDLVGIDLMPYLKTSLTRSLPQDDPYQAIAKDHPLILKMIADGYTGRKGKGGFYRINREAGKVKEAIDLATGDYRKAAKPVSIPGAAQKDLRALVSLPGKLGAYAWAVLGPTLAYSASLVGEAADDVLAIDTAMKLGYNWSYGPFELIDRLGSDALAKRLEAEGIAVPEILRIAAGRPFYRVEGGQRQFLGLDGDYHAITRPEGVLLLEDIKAASKPLLKNGSAALWDVGDGVVALEFTGKMNALDGDVMSLIGKAIPLVASQYKALVVYNEGRNFSAGANLGLALFALNIAAWGEVDKLVAGGQQAYKALKYAPFPVVAAPYGLALGGGCEVCLNADAVQAHAETYIGLVECGVGLIPGWGGCGEMIQRFAENPRLPKGPMPAVAKAFETISTATVAKSAANAKEVGYLRPSDGITMNRDRLLADAKAKALALAEGYQPPAPPTFRLPGAGGKAALDLAVQGFRARGLATPYDEVVAGRLAHVLSGGESDLVDTITEEQMLTMEREQFVQLVRDPRTLARIETMLATGKPLRN
ncbi:3-hydroxyacyl-CoA dehydrogenase/enoyl-CoA hydratase family protein [Novosphingobium terrae]|uniref:3-hydroxyacyl-CoA dehydrogenase/enoyl-CoA hydratase family protein n=1 Tax=Novosphingobium terrae TaxID=2726189 RepID=UPI00198010F4|nr:3-hydroxyacyl-CoA dehydrogenase/enoyl-CoA hydratase family protein [Novosphingobium terrae]